MNIPGHILENEFNILLNKNNHGLSVRMKSAQQAFPCLRVLGSPMPCTAAYPQRNYHDQRDAVKGA